MTKVTFNRSGYVNHMIVDGHQDGEDESLYCAAISAMSCTLINALGREKLAAEPKIIVDSGRVLVSALRTPRTDAFYDMLRAGFESMADKWPDRVRIER